MWTFKIQYWTFIHVFQYFSYFLIFYFAIKLNLLNFQRFFYISFFPFSILQFCFVVKLKILSEKPPIYYELVFLYTYFIIFLKFPYLILFHQTSFLFLRSSSLYSLRINKNSLQSFNYSLLILFYPFLFFYKISDLFIPFLYRENQNLLNMLLVFWLSSSNWTLYLTWINGHYNYFFLLLRFRGKIDMYVFAAKIQKVRSNRRWSYC